MTKWIAALALLVAPAAWAHEADIWWTPSADSANGTIGTQTVYRATGSCTATNLNFVAIKTGLTGAFTQAAPYQDLTVQGGLEYCYRVTATISGTESGASNTWDSTLISVAVPTNVQGTAK